ncbi:MAG TPA: nitrogen regulation protein NR(II) [Xanthomonadaceae bacterium]|nr:nitrogen regulation protein NR(II) [Xanthomonadaceae bacterium]
MSAVPESSGLAAMLTPVLLVDAADRIAEANPALAGWLGQGRRRLLGQPLEVLLATPVPLPELAARARASALAVVARRQQFPATVGERFADVWVVADANGAGQVRFELHPIEEFPGEDPATALPAALSAALRGLAHEIKNPLAGLKGAAQLLARRIEDPDLSRYVAVIQDESERLDKLIDRLLDPGRPAVEVEVNIHAVLERVRALAEAEAGWALRIERDYDPSLPPLLGDPDRLTQALLNLARNALEADAGEVRLRTRAEHGPTLGEHSHRLALRIEVEDNGRGVPEHLAERIFLPLVSGRAEGTGLGLPLAQQVAREHGGSLSFRSRPGHTVFALLLPLRGAEAEAADE